ncbi:MAG: hypothetical protein H7645_08955 [Candidatus Heimdallarchaeota archaeon]|nr:hypothetical protein [Candidatus Heimdallarchaeota archaeon]MCK4770454.1 hypothetical protein [Candidatus Heimdallarchaeota archaeon]
MVFENWIIVGILSIAGTMLTILGAGIPLAKGIQAAAAAVAEKQRLNIFILIYLALAEALAIYGLLIAFVMFTKIDVNNPSSFSQTDAFIFLAAMFIMIVSNLGAAITLAKGEPAAIGSITANSEVFTNNLIYLGLGEALAIYGLLIAFILLNLVT